MMRLKMLIGQRIKELRKASGLSQEELAEKMGISSKYLSSIERGLENPTLDTFMCMARALGVDMCELFNCTHHGKTEQELRALINALLEKGGDERLQFAAKIIKAIYL